MLAYMFAVSILLATFAAKADNIDCGAMPVVTDESFAGEINGQARLLSRYFGNAELSGRIEQTRKDIFSKYSDQQASRQDSALQYQMCEYLKRDTTHSDFEKFKILRDMRQSFQKPIQVPLHGKQNQDGSRYTPNEQNSNNVTVQSSTGKCSPSIVGGGGDVNVTYSGGC